MCPIYYSSLEKNKKEEVLSNFLSKNDAYNKVLVSSSALEEGLDYPSIRLPCIMSHFLHGINLMPFLRTDHFCVKRCYKWHQLLTLELEV